MSASLRFMIPVALLGLSLAIVTGHSAVAQMQLPGSIPSTPAGQVPAGAAPPRTAEPLLASFKGEDLLPGRTLQYMGASGRIVINKTAAKGLAMTFTGFGRRGNDIRQICSADFSSTGAVSMQPKGRPLGLNRYEIKFAACTLTADLLNDAIIIGTPNGACRLADDCIIEPAGLWGPPAQDLPKEADIERFRASAEKQVNLARKTLQDQLKGKPEGSAFLSEHVNFSANRERQCQSYAGASGPGFCALKLTEAWGMRIASRLRR